jgi:hypothetical protein
MARRPTASSAAHRLNSPTPRSPNSAAVALPPMPGGVHPCHTALQSPHRVRPAARGTPQAGTASPYRTPRPDPTALALHRAPTSLRSAPHARRIPNCPVATRVNRPPAGEGHPAAESQRGHVPALAAPAAPVRRSPTRILARAPPPPPARPYCAWMVARCTVARPAPRHMHQLSNPPHARGGAPAAAEGAGITPQRSRQPATARR